MVRLIPFLFLLMCFSAEARIPKEMAIATYVIDSVTTNSRLGKGKSEVIVRIDNRGFRQGEKVQYGFDGSNEFAQLDKNLSFRFKLDSGQHILQFFPTEKIKLAEISTATTYFKARTTTYITLHFQKVKDYPIHVRKPVIYLYPEEETEVSVRVHPVGEMSFTYPEYKGQWKCTAFPSGEIHVDEKSFNYLFWEAEQVVDQQEILRTQSTKVLKQDLVAFMEKSLDQFGFSSQEKMDFITFWAPIMLRHDATEIRFLMNESCDQFAELNISPTPDHVLRFYMIWNQTTPDKVDSSTILEIPQQNRTGFTVLEWGGMEIDSRLESNLAETVSH